MNFSKMFLATLFTVILGINDAGAFRYDEYQTGNIYQALKFSEMNLFMDSSQIASTRNHVWLSISGIEGNYKTSRLKNYYHVQIRRVIIADPKDISVIMLNEHASVAGSRATLNLYCDKKCWPFEYSAFAWKDFRVEVVTTDRRNFDAINLILKKFRSEKLKESP